MMLIMRWYHDLKLSNSHPTICSVFADDLNSAGPDFGYTAVNIQYLEIILDSTLPDNTRWRYRADCSLLQSTDCGDYMNKKRGFSHQYIIQNPLFP